jgi:hypothetical protein
MVHDLSSSPPAHAHLFITNDINVSHNVENVDCDSTKLSISTTLALPHYTVRDDGVVCGRCTFVNPPALTACEVCEEPIRLKKSRASNTAGRIGDSPPGDSLHLGGGPPSVSESVTTGIIPLIRASLIFEKSHHSSSSSILNAYRLGCSATPHITQKGVPMGGEWSCGFRNIQMLCHSLMALPAYR